MLHVDDLHVLIVLSCPGVDHMSSCPYDYLCYVRRSYFVLVHLTENRIPSKQFSNSRAAEIVAYSYEIMGRSYYSTAHN
jgi:hypothetical protein